MSDQYFRRTHRRPVILALLTVAVAVATIRFAPAVDAQATVVIEGYSANHSSVRVHFRAVPGARDYRIYDVNNPNDVKYAGLVHLTAATTCPGQYCDKHFAVAGDGTPVYPYRVENGGTGGPQALDVPALQIEYNDPANGAPLTLVVEAVDRLGPVPEGNLYTGDYNTPLSGGHQHGSMLGSNKGPTGDGKISTNGQGPYTNSPQVIARSQPFTVTVDRSYVAIPSGASATQAFFDTFENSQNASITQTAREDRLVDVYANVGKMKFTMNGGTPRAWEIEYRQADNNNSMPFISANHFMDMLFDGGTAGSGAPGHELFTSMAMTPVQTVDMSGGRILHLTMEVDGHQSQRKWMAFNLAPASDPLEAWHPDGGIPFNVNNRGVFMELRDGECTLDIYNGTAAGNVPTGTAGGQHGSRLWGSMGASAYGCGEFETYVPGNFGRNGLGFDDRSRYDLFISTERVALFQDGFLIRQSPIPAGSFPWFTSGPVKVYYSHYVYHTTNDVDELTRGTNLGQNNCYPMNAYWFNNPISGTQASQTNCGQAYPPGFGFRYSDERHWDNMGFETLPGSAAPSNDYSSLISLVRLPAMRPVQSGAIPAPPSNLRITANTALQHGVMSSVMSKASAR